MEKNVRNLLRIVRPAHMTSLLASASQRCGQVRQLTQGMSCSYTVSRSEQLKSLLLLWSRGLWRRVSCGLSLERLPDSRQITEKLLISTLTIRGNISRILIARNCYFGDNLWYLKRSDTMMVRVSIWESVLCRTIGLFVRMTFILNLDLRSLAIRPQWRWCARVRDVSVQAPASTYDGDAWGCPRPTCRAATCTWTCRVVTCRAHTRRMTKHPRGQFYTERK
jgi:hypothetical protein